MCLQSAHLLPVLKFTVFMFLFLNFLPSFSSSSTSFLPESLCFLSSLWHASCKLRYGDCIATQTANSPITSLIFFWKNVFVRWGEERLLTVVFVFSAGLVCMKSSTSVVELVMLLCSQVGDLSTLFSFRIISINRVITSLHLLCTYLGWRLYSQNLHAMSNGIQ